MRILRPLMRWFCFALATSVSGPSQAAAQLTIERPTIPHPDVRGLPSQWGYWTKIGEKFVRLDGTPGSQIAYQGGMGSIGAKSAGETIPGAAVCRITGANVEIYLVGERPAELYFIHVNSEGPARRIELQRKGSLNHRFWYPPQACTPADVRSVSATVHVLTPAESLGSGEYLIDGIAGRDDEAAAVPPRGAFAFERIVTPEAPAVVSSEMTYALRLRDEQFVAGPDAAALDKKNGFQEFTLGSRPGPGVEIKMPNMKRVALLNLAAATGAVNGALNHYAMHVDGVPVGLLWYFPGMHEDRNWVWHPLAENPAPRKNKWVRKETRPVRIDCNDVEIRLVKGPRDIAGADVTWVTLSYYAHRLLAIVVSFDPAERGKVRDTLVAAYGPGFEHLGDHQWNGKLVKVSLHSHSIVFQSKVMIEALAGYGQTATAIDAESARQGL